MMKTGVMIIMLVVLSSVGALSLGSHNETLLPIPMAETHERVKSWLSSNGFHIIPGYLAVDKKEIIAEKGPERLRVILKHHSAIGTKIIVICEKAADDHPCARALFENLKADDHTNSITDDSIPDSLPEKTGYKADAVVCIYADAWGRKAQFTGFVVNESGLIVCTAHDLNPELEVMVTFTDGDRLKGTIVKRDAIMDLSLIRVNKKTDHFIDLRHGRNMLSQGETLFGSVCMENPSGGLFSGHVSGPPRKTGEQALWQVRMDIVPGSSGSPVFDASGKIVAVVKGRRRGQASIGFLIPFETIVEFIQGDISQ